jgi:branched-chain amino acid transport system permease protein
MRIAVKFALVLVASLIGLAYLKLGGGSDYTIYLCTTVFLYATLASSLDLLVGLTGRISFAHAAFYGFGAYATGLSMIHWHLSFPVAALFAIGATATVSFLIGLVTIRVGGLYFALAMTALAVVFVSIIELPKLVWMTGGATGLAGLPYVSYLSGQDTWYLVFMILLAVGLVVKIAVAGSPLGRRMIALRDDEELARTLGVKTNFYKVLAFVIASTLAGVTGAFFAVYFGSLAPGDFDIWVSFSILVWVLVGGAGTLIGPMVGVALLWTVPQQLNYSPNTNLLIYGALLCTIISFQRGGLMGILRWLRAIGPWKRLATSEG